MSPRPYMTDENKKLLARLLRHFNTTGSMRAAIQSIERESGWPIAATPAFLREAERIAILMRETANAMLATSESQ